MVATIPQSVYDQFADPSITNIVMPQGEFSITRNLPVIARSNVKIDFGGGCTFVVDPAAFGNELYPLSVKSIGKNVVFGQSPGGAARKLSCLVGEIKPGGTKLAMSEPVDVQPGETVLLWVGVDKMDPVEPYGHIPAIVSSVSAEGTITFTKPFGKDIPNYASLEGFKSQVADGLRWKVGNWGEWPDEANFSKGYGFTHGLERFDGGMVSNVSIVGNPVFKLLPVSTSDLPNGCWLISTSAVNNFLLNGFTIDNPLGAALFHWRSFGVRAYDIKVTGQGKCKVWNTKIQDASVISMWGGSDLKFERLNIDAKDVSLVSTEVRPSKVVLKDIEYKVEFTDTRDYPSSPQILGFYSLQDSPKINNANFDVKCTGGSQPKYQSYWDILFDGQLKFVGPSLQYGFDWGGLRQDSFDGTVTIGGVRYGPQQMKTQLVAIPYVRPSQTFQLPMKQGLFLKGRLRIRTKGDLASVHDNMKTFNYANILNGEWKPFGDSCWYGIEAGQEALDRYKNASFIFTFNDTVAKVGSIVELNYTYLPGK